MTARQVALYTFVLIALGAGWGITQPLTKIAVSTGLGHFGLVFWQLVLGAALMAVIARLRRMPLPLEPRHIRLYVLLAMIGTILPNSASYQAAVHLPSGILSILLSMIPMWGFPIALALGLDLFSWRRLGGLLIGLTGVLLIVAPGAQVSLSLPIFWILVALVSGVFYAIEGNVVAKWGTQGLDGLQVLFGASLFGALIMLPVMVLSGQWIAPSELVGGAAGWALIASSCIHVVVYASYIWLVGRAGPVFSMQVSYLVTGFGILWAKLILAESYPPAIWAAIALMFVGMYLVQPRRNSGLAMPEPISDTVR